MLTTTSSLTDLAAGLLTRLDYILPEDAPHGTEESQWKLLHVYLPLDPILASLYKQYCEAKDNLGKLLVTHGSTDPLAEIVWDMHDSLRSAIETRLLELQEDKEVAGRVAVIEASRKAALRRKSAERPRAQQNLQDMMTFFLWVGMAMQSPRLSSCSVRRDFAGAC